MPHTCGGESRADSGALGRSDAESVMAIAATLPEFPSPRSCGERGKQELARDFLEAGDQLVDRLLDRDLLADHAVHRLGPDVLVVEDRELPVLGEVERRGAAGELGPDRLAVSVSLPERARLAFLRHREPAAERAFDIGPQ